MSKTTYIHVYGDVDAHYIEDLHDLILNDVHKETDTLYFVMCTAGGSVEHGVALYNLLRALPYKIVMHNVGNVDSIGVTVFLAADQRYAVGNATFMIHPVRSTLKGKQLTYSSAKEKLSGIESDMERIEKLIIDRTNIPQKEVNQLFEVGQVKNASKAMECGLIHEIRDFPYDAAAQKLILKSKGTA